MFSQSELTIMEISEVYARLGAHIPVYRYPVSMKEGWKKCVWNTGRYG